MKNFKYILNKNLSKQVIKKKFELNKTILDFIVKQSVIKIIKERCKDMGYIECEKENEIKLFGNHNLFLDNSIWVEIDDKTRFSDIFFTKAEIYLVLKEIFTAVGAECKCELAFELSQKEKINNLLDIKQIVDDNFNKL